MALLSLFSCCIKEWDDRFHSPVEYLMNLNVVKRRMRSYLFSQFFVLVQV